MFNGSSSISDKITNCSLIYSKNYCINISQWLFQYCEVPSVCSFHPWKNRKLTAMPSWSFLPSTDSPLWNCSHSYTGMMSSMCCSVELLYGKGINTFDISSTYFFNENFKTSPSFLNIVPNFTLSFED